MYDMLPLTMYDIMNGYVIHLHAPPQPVLPLPLIQQRPQPLLPGLSFVAAVTTTAATATAAMTVNGAAAIAVPMYHNLHVHV